MKLIVMTIAVLTISLAIGCGAPRGNTITQVANAGFQCLKEEGKALDNGVSLLGAAIDIIRVVQGYLANGLDASLSEIDKLSSKYGDPIVACVMDELVSQTQPLVSQTQGVVMETSPSISQMASRIIQIKGWKYDR